MQAGMERAREVADGERASTQSPEAIGADAAADGSADASLQAGHSSGEGSSGSSDDRGQDGDSAQQVPELYAPGRLLYIRQESGADERHVRSRLC